MTLDDVLRLNSLKHVLDKTKIMSCDQSSYLKDFSAQIGFEWSFLYSKDNISSLKSLKINPNPKNKGMCH